MPTSQERIRAIVAIAKDLLPGVPGKDTFTALVEKEIRERDKRAFNAIVEELKKASDEGIEFEENDVHDFVQMVLRLLDAVAKGTARRNLRLMAQVIVGLKRHQLIFKNGPTSLKLLLAMKSLS